MRLEPGQEVGLHKTENKEEVIVCLEGNPALVIEGEKRIISPGEVVFIKEELEHNVINESDVAAEYVYVVHLF